MLDARPPGAARVRALLRGEPVDVGSSEAMLGYRLRQHHLGVVTWITGASGGGDALGRLEHVTAEVAAEAHCEGRPIFIPQDEFSAWAWLPLGARRDIAFPRLSAKGTGGRHDPGSLSVSLRWDCRVSAEPISRR